ncbi:site-specific DNA-methyltransferase [Pseudoduganella buxea]|uniref:site-specific DNA-methyltransferase (adenine-specific) n=1 Tax=Pseudoduganella buxea TaxID=1949069 RepID=A0A6I3T2H6_9BURK|nr:DNA methyltransferase [Pseudoduganella buxea]MTV54956.1 site-specific DNA-methyltransferase [Pseudoduganella buxea]GGC17315.1 site-specific DNA-methyltransferase [Pseudoduganella buxea]
MTNKHNPKFQELIAKLREIFQIDRPELDFGIYRILNARAGEINDYLENRLADKVQAALSAGSAASAMQLQADLDEAIKQAQALGANPDDLPKVKDLRARLKAATTGRSEHENAVFSHLLAFFSRYYEQGDFISQRRYKGDTYAIPYAGEEVMLHWANKDQYYTKSGENFSNYSFKLDDGRTVHFRLVAADTAKDNRKDNDKERRFALVEKRIVIRIDDQGDEYEEEILPVEEVDGANGKELIVRFDYATQPKGTKQEALVTKAVEAVLADVAVKARWLALGNRMPTEKNPQRTLLGKSLTDYTTKNTADYFIHKDLGGFLRRELDFYIKNEVMHLDDVQNAGAIADIEKSLRMIQCLRAIALELIAFLAQLEDFQKKLWLKKKFVVSSHYCITLDRVPEELRPEVAANGRQWAQWKQLGVWDGDKPGTAEDLKAAPYRMVDTSLFDGEVVHKLVASIEDIDASVNGLLINGDNFQGLSLLQTKYRERVTCIYIDPPYNTDASAIIYKNGYKDSSWLSLIQTRLDLAKRLMQEDSLISVAIDDQEASPLVQVLNSTFEKQVGVAVVKSNPQSRKTKGKFSPVHEYAFFYGKSEKSLPYTIGYSASKAARYPLEDEQGRYAWMNFIRAGSNDLRTDRPRLYYPIAVSASNKLRILKMEWNEERQAYDLLEQPDADESLVYPIREVDGTPVEKNWQRGHIRVSGEYAEHRVRRNAEGEISIDFKTRMDDEAAPVTWWDKGEYASANYGAPEQKEYFGEKLFDFPKAKKLVEDAIRACGAAEPESITLDFFAGSGTTGEAVLRIGRETKGTHRFILVEQGSYFDTIVKPRIQKVIYSADWKDGRPTAAETGISHCFKVLKLESYEDALNNLQLRRTAAQGDLLNALPETAKDDFLLRYMLDVESRDSLLSVADFKKPFDYTLNVAVDSAGAFEPRKIDLVETFNYLVGLRVKHIDAQLQRGFTTVNGTLPSGESCLVLWRDCDVLDYDGISKLCDKLAINPADNEFDVVYINGDHNIPTVLTQTAEEGGVTRVLKLRQIEPEFLERMFSVEDI